MSMSPGSGGSYEAIDSKLLLLTSTVRPRESKRIVVDFDGSGTCLLSWSAVVDLLLLDLVGIGRSGFILGDSRCCWNCLGTDARDADFRLWKAIFQQF